MIRAVLSKKLLKSNNWLGLWLLGLLLGLGAPWLAHGQAASPFVVRVTPAGPISLPAGSSQTLTATATYPLLNAGTGFDGAVNALALQPDGKIIVGGDFTSYMGTVFTGYNGPFQNRLVRLNADGSLDASFAVGTGLNGPANAVLVQPDGRIVVGGSFSTYNGQARNNLVRLNADGSVDASFRQAGTGLNDAVKALALQPDGQLLVGGNFTSYNGTPRTYLARLTTIGNLEATLVPDLLRPVAVLALQADGNILAAGLGLVRLTPNGRPDPSYAAQPTTSGGSHPIGYYYTSLALQPDGKVVAGGYNAYLVGTRIGFVQRLDAAGKVEFNLGFNNTLTGFTTVALQPDGRILVGVATFSATRAVTYLYRLTAAGALESSLGGSSNYFDVAPVNAIVVQPNGQILIGGDFTNYNGTTQNRLARLNADGSLNTTPTPVADASYVWSTGATGPSITVNATGTYSATATANGQSVTSNAVAITVTPTPATPFVVRVTPAGPISLPAGGSQTLTAAAVYPPLATGTGFNGAVTALAVQPDGKIVVGGEFTSFNGTARNHLARLNSDGSLDASFGIGSGLLDPSATSKSANGEVNAVLVQPDGRIVVGSSFRSYNGVARAYLVRLNADGSVDASFRQTGTGFSDPVTALALQPDGQLLVGGNFTSYNGTPRTYLARLNTIGNLEATLVPSLLGPVTALALQADGNLVVAGNSYLVRLTPKGSVDPSYAGLPGTSGGSHPITYYYTSLALQPDGRVVVGGYNAYLIGARVGFVQRLGAAGKVESYYSFNNSQSGFTVVAVQPDGRILAGVSTFSSTGVVTYLYRLTAAGALETALGGSSVIGDLAPVNAIVVQPNGQVLIGGAFTNYNGAIVNRLARLNADGTLNSTDTPVAGASYAWNTNEIGPSITVRAAGTYLATATLNGKSATSNPVVVRGAGPAAQSALATQPLETSAALARPLAGSPNPGTDHVQLRFALAQTEAYTLTVYDGQGRLVEALAGGTGSAGEAQQVEWQVGSHAAGLYLVRLQTPTVKQQLKFVKQ